MGALMRSIDWSTTAVGPVDAWPQSLRTALSILLETGFPMYIAWGRDFTQFYNDGYRPILGSTKHPMAMGASTRETFAEIWDIIGPMFQGVMEGRATNVVDFMLPLDRHGFAEECYFIFSYSPIREESGRVGGVLVTVTETTARVLGERRLKTTQALAAETREAKTAAEACEIAGRVLATNSADLPFARIYLLAEDGPTAVLAAACGAAPPGSGSASDDRTGRRPVHRRPSIGPPGGVGRRNGGTGHGAPARVFNTGPDRAGAHRATGGRPSAWVFWLPAPASACRSTMPIAIFSRWSRRRSAPPSPPRRRSKRRRRAPRRWPSSIAPRPRSSATSATNSARRSR